MNSAFDSGGDGESDVIQTPSIVDAFSGDIDGEERLLIGADSPRDDLPGATYNFNEPNSAVSAGMRRSEEQISAR